MQRGFKRLGSPRGSPGCDSELWGLQRDAAPRVPSDRWLFICNTVALVFRVLLGCLHIASYGGCLMPISVRTR